MPAASAATALPPGPRLPNPLQTLGWMVRPLPFLERCHARYGDVFTLRIGQEAPWVMLAHPDHVKQVFTADPTVVHAGEANAILGPILGSQSVLLLDEGPHMRQRKLLLPPFHGERMQRYGDVMTEVAEREVAAWPANEPLALQPRMQTLTLEIILRAVFGAEGADLDRLRAALSGMLAEVTSVGAFVLVAALGPERIQRLPWHAKLMRPVDDAVLDAIRRRRDAPDLAQRDDILSLLLQARHEDGSPMTDGELRDELMTLLVAGHETTATALSWALERLLRHPGGLDRVRAGDEAYTDAAIKETLRLRPVIPIVVRKLTAPMTFGEQTIPAGVTVVPNIHLMHRRADVYPDPRAFRPERFLDARPGTYTWLPFGGGVRRCLGANFALFEMRVVLEVVARRLALRPSQPQSERVRRRAITLAPERGGEVVAEPLAA